MRALDLQRVMIYHADDDLLVLDHFADCVQVARTGRAGLERQRIGSLLFLLFPPSSPLTPLLSLHRLVEDADEILHVELAERLAPRRHHVNLRLFQLDHRAAGIGEIVQLLLRASLSAMVRSTGSL